MDIPKSEIKSHVIFIATVAIIIALIIGGSFFVKQKEDPVSLTTKELTKKAVEDAESSAESAATAAQSARRAADSTKSTAESANRSSEAANQSAHDAAKNVYERTEQSRPHK
jgi:hypothetical protein